MKFLFFVCVLCLGMMPFTTGCKTPAERRRDAARLDSLRRDSTRPVSNPYKAGQGTEMYNQQRENLGNIDSLVTPQQPTIPNQ